MHVKPLISVIEYQHLSSTGERPLRSGCSVRIGDDLGLRNGVLVYQYLIGSVAAEQNSRDQPSGHIVARCPDGDRSLS
jgi:hypothetical protein